MGVVSFVSFDYNFALPDRKEQRLKKSDKSDDGLIQRELRRIEVDFGLISGIV